MILVLDWKSSYMVPIDKVSIKLSLTQLPISQSPKNCGRGNGKNESKECESNEANNLRLFSTQKLIALVITYFQNCSYLRLYFD